MHKLMTCIMALAAALSMLLSTGCQSATPSKAQIGEVHAENIDVSAGSQKALYEVLQTLALGGATATELVEVIKASTEFSAVSEVNVISQAMTNETGGDETNSQTASGPENPIDVTVPTGTDAITALTGAAAEGAVKALKSSGDGNAGDAAVVDPNCPDGNCADPAPSN